MKDKAFSLEVKKIVCINKCISEAIGDDIKGCLRREQIDEKRSNGKKFLKWDLVNRNFIMNFSAGNLTAEYAKRGAWNMVPLYDKETGTIYTVMREERFREIQRKQTRRKKAHYVDALVKSFNFDLSREHQLSLLEEESFDEEEDWSAYITHSESVVVDTVVVSNEPHTPNIKLKDKARKKAEQRELVVLKENTQGQNVQNN